MHLKIKMLSLNDTVSKEIPKQNKIPTSQEIGDEIVLLWREEPDTEASSITDIYDKVLQRHPEWEISQDTFEKILLDHNLYATDETKLRVYSDKVQFPPCPNLNEDKDLPMSKKHLENIKIQETDKGLSPMGRGLFAKKDFKPGQLIYTEDSPICIIPPMEKLTLISHGKACALCGSSLGSISSHFIMTNGLDCNDCAATWCSKKCKTKDIIHGPLKHNKGNKNRLVNCGNWTKFESFCQTNINETAYSLGIIYAKLLLNKSSSKTIRQHFETLCGVSQRIRNNLGDSTNIGGTLDASSGALTTEDPIPIWETTYKLFIDSFPTLKDEIDLETFLCHIGKLNINKVSNNQVYFITSFINHNCEPNIRYEIDSKLKLSVFARKDIKPGEQLFVTYVNPLHGVKLRRRALRVNYGFICKCSRCIKELDRLQTPQKSTGITMNYTKEKEGNSKNGLNLLFPPTSTTSKRRSSLRNKRPDLQELLKNGKEFDLEIPDVIGIGRRRRTSVRFDDTVAVAIEE